MTPEGIELLSELTIVIPTYNRPLALERSIEYWRDTPVTVHILDGSERAFFTVGLQPGTSQIFYHSFPQISETATDNWGRRLKFGTSLIESRFGALCCDDDVFTVSGLLIALNYLSDGTVESVIGKTSEYLLQGKDINWTQKYSHWKDEKLQKSDVLSERLMFDSGAHAFYGIFKSGCLKKIHNIGHSYSFPVPVWHSMLVITLIKVFCRIKYVDNLLWLKCAVNRPESRPIKFAQLFWDEQFSEYREKFLNSIGRALQVAEPSLTINETNNIIRSYRTQFTKPKKRRRVEVRLKAQLLLAISKLPKYFREIIFAALPGSIKKRVGNSNFTVNFRPNVLLLERDLIDDSLQNWERILLMPREELRLRADI